MILLQPARSISKKIANLSSRKHAWNLCHIRLFLQIIRWHAILGRKVMQTPNLQDPTTTLYILYTLNEPFSFKLKKITVSHVSDPLKIWRPRELLVWF